MRASFMLRETEQQNCLEACERDAGLTAWICEPASCSAGLTALMSAPASAAEMDWYWRRVPVADKSWRPAFVERMISPQT